MAEENKPDLHQAPSMSDALKGWIMVALTLIFVVLYAAALFGLIKPLADISVVTRLEPIIFVIIGYYFGRLPAQANENTLKNEIIRQTQKTDAAQQIKEKTAQEREVLEEKIRNTQIALTPHASHQLTKSASVAGGANANSPNQAVDIAIKILDS